MFKGGLWICILLHVNEAGDSVEAEEAMLSWCCPELSDEVMQKAHQVTFIQMGYTVAQYFPKVWIIAIPRSIWKFPLFPPNNNSSLYSKEIAVFYYLKSYIKKA